MYKYIILDGTICAQNTSTIIIEFACPEYGSAGRCEGRISGTCNCAIQPTQGPTTYPTIQPTIQPSVLPTVPTYVPTLITPQPGSCISGQQFCEEQCNCGSGYYECSDDRWVRFPMPSI